MLARQNLGHGHTFVLGLVGQHRAFDHVTNGIDAFDVGGPDLVGGDLTAVGHFDAKRVEAKPVGVRFAPGCDQHDIGLKRHIIAAFLG